MIESRGLYMEINEGELLFVFGDNTKAYKFDDDKFYRKEFNILSGSKGVDIIASSDKFIHMIEIKNCKGKEQDNIWRIGVNNKNIKKRGYNDSDSNKESYDIEIPKKVAMTIACLYGAFTMRNTKETAEELKKYWSIINTEAISNDRKQLIITLFLEGDFENCYTTRSKKMIMTDLQKSIRNKLRWLNCKVAVVDSSTYNQSYYKVEHIN